MKALNAKEKTELKRITKKIRTGKATQRELLRAISLTNRDHAEAKRQQQD